MRKIDVFNHILPAPYFNRMMELAGDLPDLGKRALEIPYLHDLDLHFRVMDEFEDYAQIISIGPPLEQLLKDPAAITELTRIANDSLAELVRDHPDRFPGFVAQVALNDPEAAEAEAERAVKQLGANAIQIFSNVGGRPLDRPEFEPFFAKANELDRALFIHPARGPAMPDYFDEEKSKYEIWWVFGWPYETSVAMSRLVFSGILDRYPNIRILAHHLGAMVPFFEGRVGPGWDQLGSRTSDEDYAALLKSLNKRPLDYFKEMYADTAVFGSRSATLCGLDFYGEDHVLFASDAPFDPEKGPGYIRVTIDILDSIDISDDVRRKIYVGNAERLLKAKFE